MTLTKQFFREVPIGFILCGLLFSGLSTYIAQQKAQDYIGETVSAATLRLASVCVKDKIALYFNSISGPMHVEVFDTLNSLCEVEQTAATKAAQPEPKMQKPNI